MKVGRRIMTLAIPCVALVAAAALSLQGKPPLRFAGGDGGSQATAITLVGWQAGDDLRRAETLGLAKVHPTWRLVADGEFVGSQDSLFEVVDAEGPDGPHQAWIDVTPVLAEAQGKPL